MDSSHSESADSEGDRGPDSVLEASLSYLRRGWSVVPVKKGEKRPAVPWTQYQTRRVDEVRVRKWFDPASGGKYLGVAIILGRISGNLVVRDFDDGRAYDRWAEEYSEYARVLPTVKTRRGAHVYLRVPATSTLHKTLKFTDGELRYEGSIVVAPPSVHPEGVRYEWLIPPPRGEILEIDPAEIGLIVLPAEEKCGKSRRARGVIREGARNTRLTSLAGRLRRTGASQETILADLLEENRKRCLPPLPEREVESIAQSVARYPPGGDEIHLTELGNARRLVRCHGCDLRYVATRKRWLAWDGRRWRLDDTGEAIRRAKATVASIYVEAAQCEDDKERKRNASWAMKSEAEKAIRAMVVLAQSEPGIAVVPGVFDADPWLLNCLNGTLDLRNGTLRPHRREDLITRVVPVDYRPNAKYPRWLRFLNRVTGGDSHLQAFLKRAVGYSLTGSTREQVVFFLYGTGQNGKSKFLEVLRLLLGEYAVNTPTKTLVVRSPSEATNDLARLHGARLVTAVEWEEGQRLAESLIKQMTGEDSLTARFLHQEYFDFVPSFKLFLATNHKPTLRGGDLAIRRRVRLVPFSVTIPEAERDKEIVDKLRLELPGVLCWAIEGCLEWQQDGLGEPDAVQEATRDYLDEMDLIGRFLTEDCIREAGIRTPSAVFYKNFTAWSEQNGEKAMSQTAFGLRLKERGLESRKIRGVNHWLGIGPGSKEVND